MYTDRKSHWKTKELPQDQRPYDKCLMYGAEALTNRELIAAVLQTGSAGLNSLETADLILDSCRDKGGLTGLYKLTIAELTDIPGIGPAKAARICCIGELSRRMAASTGNRTRRFQSPEDIADFYMERLRQKDQETVWCLMLDTKHGFLGEKMISQGTVNVSLLSSRDIFTAALAYKAVSIVLVHNHPSGDCSPSEEDISSTRIIAKAGEMVGIHLLDHIIIGDRCYTSLREYDEELENYQNPY